MIVFEDELAKLIELMPPITSGELSQTINFGWGTEEVLMKYLVLKKKLSFPLIWLEENADDNNLREPSVTRNARLWILYESQAPTEFNSYQHEYDYNVILQPICDNLIKVLKLSGISFFDDTKLRTRRVKNFSTRNETESLIYICNAIVFESEIKFVGGQYCLDTTIFNN